MPETKQSKLLSILSRSHEWHTASDLAAQLGVSDRSVRSYVSALNARTSDGNTVESGPQGYRAGVGAHTQPASAERAATPTTPAQRQRAMCRMLLDQPDGVDLHAVAARFHVSDSTTEADLVRLRKSVADFDVDIPRASSKVFLAGTESAFRRLTAWLIRSEYENEDGLLTKQVAQAFEATSPAREVFGPFRVALDEALQTRGYALNEMSVGGVLLDIAIIVDRSHLVEEAPERWNVASHQVREIADLLHSLFSEHLSVEIRDVDAEMIAALLLTRMIVAPEPASIADAALASTEVLVRQLLADAGHEFRAELVDEDLVRRLSRHVHVLGERARLGMWSPNSLTRSLKASYPLTFDIAVSIASGLSEHLNTSIPDEEIAYIAMHLAALLEAGKDEEPRLKVAIVSPTYLEVQELLRTRVVLALGAAVEVIGVYATQEAAFENGEPDLVLSTNAPTVTSERTVRIQPFLTDADVDRINAVVSRLRRDRKRARIREELERYVVPEAFILELASATREEAIAELGGRLVANGSVDAEFIARVEHREAMSSTAFVDGVAIPHATHQHTERTALAVGLAPNGMEWGDSRVHIVVLVAFSHADKDAFQLVFEQLVEVLSARGLPVEVSKKATDPASFICQLLTVTGNEA